LYQQILLAALGTTALLGVALFRVLRSARRRAIFELRLKGIAMATPIAAKLEMSLRKPATQRRPLLARLDPALAATGNRIGVPHLAASGIIAASVIGLAAALTQLRPALAATLGGAGAVAGPAVLLRLAQSRYQRQFLDIFPDALDLIVRAVGGLFLINRELMSVLFVDPRGRFMLGIACISLLLGVAAMKAMIKSNLR